MLLEFPVNRRTVLSAARAGNYHLVVMTPAPIEIDGILDETHATVISLGETTMLPDPGHCLILASNVLPNSMWLKKLVELL